MDILNLDIHHPLVIIAIIFLVIVFLLLFIWFTSLIYYICTGQKDINEYSYCCFRCFMKKNPLIACFKWYSERDTTPSRQLINETEVSQNSRVGNDQINTLSLSHSSILNEAQRFELDLYSSQYPSSHPVPIPKPGIRYYQVFHASCDNSKVHGCDTVGSIQLIGRSDAPPSLNSSGSPSYVPQVHNSLEQTNSPIAIPIVRDLMPPSGEDEVEFH